MTKLNKKQKGKEQPVDTIIREETSPRKYFTIIPNIIDDLGLTPYEFRLYSHIVRVSGLESSCWQSTSTLAEKCQMSVGSVSKARKSLAEKGLIRIVEEKCPGGVCYLITVVDIWEKNMANFSQPSPGEAQPSPHEAQPSPGETKKNPIKNNTIKNKDILPNDDQPTYTQLESLFMKTWRAKRLNQEQRNELAKLSDFSVEAINRFVRWARIQNLPMGKAIFVAAKTIQNWNTPKKSGNGGRANPINDAAIRKLKEEFGHGQG